MLTDSILRLKIAFANTPMRGLFFWEGLLFLEDDEYKKVVEGSFIDVANSFSGEEELVAYYKGILEDLKKVRMGIFEDPEVRNEVEKIREAHISEVARETIINIMEDSLAPKQNLGVFS
ncbi:hypothetical protein GAMM_60251 [Gammaproteobacteria bacterium]